MRMHDYWGCYMACICHFFCLRPQDMPLINGQCSKYSHLCPRKLRLHLVVSERWQEHYKNVQSCYVKHLMPYYHVSSQEPITIWNVSGRSMALSPLRWAEKDMENCKTAPDLSVWEASLPLLIMPFKATASAYRSSASLQLIMVFNASCLRS